MFEMSYIKWPTLQRMNYSVPFRIVNVDEDIPTVNIPFHLAPQFEYYPYLYVPGRSNNIGINYNLNFDYSDNDIDYDEDNIENEDDYDEDDEESSVYAYEYDFNTNNLDNSTLLNESVTPSDIEGSVSTPEIEDETTSEDVTPPELDLESDFTSNFPTEQRYDPQSRNLSFRHMGFSRRNGTPRLVYDISMFNLPQNNLSRQERVRRALNRLGMSLVNYSSFEIELDLLNQAIESSVADMEIRRRDNIEIDLPDLVFNDIKHTTTDQTQCSICFTDFENEDSVCKLNCSHLLHSPCIREWAKYKDTCPICRAEIPIKTTL